MNSPIPGMLGTLFVVATPIGNLEDITLRALRVLKEVQVVAAEDTRRTGLLLQHFEIRTPLVSLHEHNEHARTAPLVARLAAGESIALVSDAGTPLVSDPGFRLVREAVQAGITVVAVPGASALTAALSVAGLPIEGFTFAGFAPARSAERRRWLRRFAAMPGTLVFFEAPHRVTATLSDMHAELGDRWAVLARELTKIHETTTRGWLSDLLAGTIQERGEYVIMLSDQNKGAGVQGCKGARVQGCKSAGARVHGGKSAGVRGCDHEALARADVLDIGAEFGRMTETVGLSARDAVAQLAEKSGLPRQTVYRQLKKAGLLG